MDRWPATRLLPVVALLCSACPDRATRDPVADVVGKRPIKATAGKGPRRAQADAAAASQPTGKPWKHCDGSLSVEDIPEVKLTAVVAGKALEPTAMVVRGSVLGKAIRFDFARPQRWDKARPCFLAESPLAAGLEHKDDRYAKQISLEAGQYRLGSGWRAYYSIRDAKGSRIERRPAYYGLLVIERASGLSRKPTKMFEPTGRVKGKLAICFKDEHHSWIAGSFDVPACGDQPDG